MKRVMQDSRMQDTRQMDNKRFDEISTARIEATFTALCSIGPRWQGSDGEMKTLAYLRRHLREELKVDALEEPFRYLGFHARSAGLRVLEGQGEQIPSQPLAYSPSGTMEGELRYVEEGALDHADYSGKIVLTDAVRSYLAYPQAVRGKASGFVFGNNLGGDLIRVGITNYEGRVGAIPALAVGSEDTRLLKGLAQRGAKVRMEVDCVTREGTGINLVIREPGERGCGTVLVISHYDSMWLGPHANDNASGVASVLELIRCFRGKGIPLIFLLCGAEELGFWGSRSFARQHEEECRGYAGIVCTDGISSRLGPLEIGVSEDLEPTVKGLLGRFPLNVQRWSIPPRPGSDHSSFFPFQKPTFWLTTNAPYYHTAGDVPEQVDMENLRDHTEFTARVILEMASRKLTNPPGDANSKVVRM